ncbi:hypothetical protein BA92_03415 [Sanguibacteroides justesenii]|uniref:Uncharacterized protein n=1 Tax=Sanguibacteroides justesenii TaxID=1547597 RepID=A0A0C3RFJ7_9PORP|nr:hypothetical protein BA92_03415 [Sanguibacteroides justesenii]
MIFFETPEKSTIIPFKEDFPNATLQISIDNVAILTSFLKEAKIAYPLRFHLEKYTMHLKQKYLLFINSQHSGYNKRLQFTKIFLYLAIQQKKQKSRLNRKSE